MPLSRSAMIRFASKMDVGSTTRRRFLATLKMAAMQTFHTDSGRVFKISPTDYAKFLRDEVFVQPGVAMGLYLRDEKTLPDKYLPILKTYGGRYTESGPRKTPTRLPDIDDLWEGLIQSLRKVKVSVGEVKDLYVMCQEDDFASWVDSISTDISENMESALDPQDAVKLQKFEEAIRTKQFKGGQHDNWSPRYRLGLLQELYGDYWASAVLKVWEMVRRDPQEVARLNTQRV